MRVSAAGKSFFQFSFKLGRNTKIKIPEIKYFVPYKIICGKRILGKQPASVEINTFISNNKVKLKFNLDFRCLSSTFQIQCLLLQVV